MKVKQIKIDFNVTPEIKRFVFVYAIMTKGSCYLIDSGVAGSEEIIEKTLVENGFSPADVKGIFLTHAHPDHIGSANYFRNHYGAKIYASEGERAWIEDIDLQFKERPIPNFYNLAGHSTIVDCAVKDKDTICLEDDLTVEVIGTAGHSADQVSYRINDMIFIGDAIPVKGDIPIFIDLEKTKNTIRILQELEDIRLYYPAWDQTYSYELMQTKLAEAKELVDKLESAVRKNDNNMDILELVNKVSDNMQMPMLKSNPLFTRTVEALHKLDSYKSE